MNRKSELTAVVILKWYWHLDKWFFVRAVFPTATPDKKYRLVYVESLYDKSTSLRERFTKSERLLSDTN